MLRTSTMVGLVLTLTFANTACNERKQPRDLNHLQKDWVKKTDSACRTTSMVLKKFYKNTMRFEVVFDEEVEKTKRGRRPLTWYNPLLFRRLSEALELIDVTNPKLKSYLNKNVWTTHYRFVRNAKDLLPRLHTFLALLAQLKVVVSLGLDVDSRHGKLLKKMIPGAKPPKQRKKPMFGVLIRGNFGAVFTGELGKPVKNMGPGQGSGTKCVDATVETAEGYRLSDGNCYWFSKPPTKRGECAKYNNTLRYFQNTDAELFNRMKCTGMERIFFESWRHNVVQIKLLLAEINAVNPKDLYRRFRDSSAVASDLAK